ncbi:MAG: hypothetical protein RIT81_36555 [Deltaproteobacteria bacterium]
MGQNGGKTGDFAAATGQDRPSCYLFRMAGFVSELKRRNVFRVAATYLVVAWLLLQVAALLETTLKLPDWFDGTVTALVFLGFPIALVLAWAFEVTPEGVQRTRTGAEASRTTALDMVLLVVLVVVGGAIAVDRFSGAAASSSDSGRPAAATKQVVDAGAGLAVEGPAIAVLPFNDLSANGDQAYFSDGLAEELLNTLAQDSNLRIAGRTSSFAFKGKDQDLREIAKTLNVTHVLEGSVRKDGNKIRVTAQLIEAAGGFHVFSRTYDRELEDIFAVQDDIAQRIGTALRSRLSPKPRIGPENVEAYDLYLQARQALYIRTRRSLAEAEALLDRALALAPEYAPIYAAQATTKILLSNAFGAYGERPASVELPKAKVLIDRALELDPLLADAHAVLGLYRESWPVRTEDPVAPLERALALNPNHSEAQLWLSAALRGSPKAVALLERVVERDPAFPPAVQNLSNHYAGRREADRLETLFDRAERVPGTKKSIIGARAQAALFIGDLVEAYRTAKLAYARAPDDIRTLATYGSILIALGEFDEALRVDRQEIRATVHALRGDRERAFAELRAASLRPDVVGVGVNIYTEAQEWKAAVTVYERAFGTLRADGDPIAARQNFPFLSSLALALRKLGRTEVSDKLLDTITADLERGEGLGYAESPYALITRAELDALRGDTDAALRHLDRAIENGLVSANALSPVLHEYLDRGEKQKRVQRIWDRVDAERAKLGWGPFERPQQDG